VGQPVAAVAVCADLSARRWPSGWWAALAVSLIRMPIIEQDWTRVLQRLEAEVSVFARLAAHEGERGRENEACAHPQRSRAPALRHRIGPPH
jgi:hypothetical protein